MKYRNHSRGDSVSRILTNKRLFLQLFGILLAVFILFALLDLIGLIVNNPFVPGK